MKAFLALIRREQIEHRAAFMLAPAIIVVALAAMALTMSFSGRPPSKMLSVFNVMTGYVQPVGYLALSGLWWLYLLLTLAFYFTESFSADRRNNSMLFWKSMPQSDLKMLLAKFVAGITVFPFFVFIAAVVTGILVYITVGIAMMGLSNYQALSLNLFDLGTFAEVTGGIAAYFALGILWFVPFYAWAAMLGAVFGRWAIPLGFFVPALVVLAEFLLFSGSNIRDYLWRRFEYGLDFEGLQKVIEQSGGELHVGQVLSFHISTIDFTQMGIGFVAAAVFIYIASEYRRRRNDN